MAVRKDGRKNAVATIKDIAREGGVSVATVSRAMTGEKGMSQETRERILAIADRLHYIPNLQARGLVAKTPELFGIVICRTSEITFSNPYFSEVLKGIGKKVKESGNYLLISFSDGESYARMYQHGLAAGIVVLSYRIGDPKIEEAWKLKVPMVLIPGCLMLSMIPSVDVDNIDAAVQAVDHLVGLGHKRIAFINGLMSSKYSVERLTGYRKALKKNHLPSHRELVVESDFTQEGGYQSMKKCLSLPQPPTAVLVINDYSAMGVLRAAKEMGFRVPEDISIVGFGDVPFASMVDPPLTTVREPFQRIGRDAADMLLKLIQRKRVAKKHVVLPVELIVRKSTAPPSR